MKRHFFLPLVCRLLLFFSAVTLFPAAELFAVDFQPLIGRWQRTDGGYVLEIRNIAADGTATVRYYNPRPINVAKAEASKTGSTVRLFVELRDAGYPGSTYTLVYEPKKDALLGIYYHAGNRQYFKVVFLRIK